MKEWKKLKKELLEDPEFRKEYESSELEYQIARAVIKARIEKGYTQKALATQIHTHQSVISRLESAKTLPSLSLLKRLAQTMGLSLSVQFK